MLLGQPVGGPGGEQGEDGQVRHEVAQVLHRHEPEQAADESVGQEQPERAARPAPAAAVEREQRQEGQAESEVGRPEPRLAVHVVAHVVEPRGVEGHVPSREQEPRELPLAAGGLERGQLERVERAAELLLRRFVGLGAVVGPERALEDAVGEGEDRVARRHPGAQRPWRGDQRADR